MHADMPVSSFSIICHPRVFLIFSKRHSPWGVYHKNWGYKFVTFSYTGSKFIKFVPRVRRVVHYCIILTSSDVTVTSMVYTTHKCCAIHILKGRALKPSHPILPQFVAFHAHRVRLMSKRSMISRGEMRKVKGSMKCISRHQNKTPTLLPDISCRPNLQAAYMHHSTSPQDS